MGKKWETYFIIILSDALFIEAILENVSFCQNKSGDQILFDRKSWWNFILLEWYLNWITFGPRIPGWNLT